MFPAATVEIRYPVLQFDLRRDDFVVWLRWVAVETPPSPASPPNQGMRIELQISKNPVLGPTVVWRRDLEEAPLYLRANRARTIEVLRRLSEKGLVDLQLVIHGSIANAPYAALYHVRDYPHDAIDTRPLEGTPLLQVQPSTPGDRWHVAGQANVRLRLELTGQPVRLTVVR